MAGKTLLLVGAVLVLSTLFARFELARVNTGRAEAKLPPLLTFAEAIPQYPTWLVPESVVGFSIAAALVVAGMTLATLAEKAAKR